MAKSFYLPSNDNNKRAWLNNFSTQLSSLGAGLGVTATEITEVQKDVLAVNYVLENLEIFKTESQERTRYKDLLFEGEIGSPLGDLPGLPTLPVAPSSVPAGVFKRISKLVQRIKNHANYNEALGKNLGIIGAEKVIDYDNLKVNVSLKYSNSDGVALDFVKGKMDGVVIYSGTIVQETAPEGVTPGTELEPPVMIWTELSRATISPFIDTRLNAGNLPETRNYKMRYMKKDQPVGKDSDTITVIAVKFKAGAELSGKVK
jgi:hypothetical protein